MRNVARNQVLPPFEMPIPAPVVPHVPGMTAIEIGEVVAGYVRWRSFLSWITAQIGETIC